MDASCFINGPTVHVLPSPSCIHVSPPPPRQPPPFLRLTGELECRVCEACTAMDARPPRLHPLQCHFYLSNKACIALDVRIHCNVIWLLLR